MHFPPHQDAISESVAPPIYNNNRVNESIVKPSYRRYARHVDFRGEFDVNSLQLCFHPQTGDFACAIDFLHHNNHPSFCQ